MKNGRKTDWDRAIELEMADVVEFLISKGVKPSQPAKNYDESILEDRAVLNPNLKRPKKELGELCTLEYAGSDVRSWRAVVEREASRPVNLELFPDKARPSKKMLSEAAGFIGRTIESNLEYRQQAIERLVEPDSTTLDGISLFRIEYSSPDSWALYFDINNCPADFGDVLFVQLSKYSGNELSRLAAICEPTCCSS